MTPQEKAADLRLRRVFGITLEEYNVRLADQNGVCKICGRPPGTKRLAVDHDHKFDRVKIRITKAETGMSNSSLWKVVFEKILNSFEFIGSKIEARVFAKRKLRRASIRGLLCVNCNRGLQKFYDKPERFEAAARYLREFSQKVSNEKPA